MQAKIIIANKNSSNEIKNQLAQSNRAANTLVFRIDMVNGREQLCEGSMCSNEVIVSFSGGIGNQMFQYVLYKIFQGQGKSVLADVSVCKRGGSDSFALDKAFPDPTAFYRCQHNLSNYIHFDNRNKQGFPTFQLPILCIC